MKTRRVACLALYKDKDTLLIQDRTNFENNHGVNYGWWGGGIKEGETPEQAIKREIKEELDIEILDFDFIVVFKNIYLDCIVEVNLFIAKAPPEFRCFEGEPMEVSVDEARELFNEGDRPSLDKVKEWLDKNDIPKV